jgi:hypothetical protein
MSLLWHCGLFFLPFLLVASGAPAKWHLDSVKPGRRELIVLLCFYVLPYALIWACAAGALPAVDRALFSQRPRHWCLELEAALALPPQSFMGCRHLKFFLYDNLTAVFPALAAASWWVREVRGLPRWMPRLIAGAMLFVMLEECKYRPFSALLNPDWDTPSFNLHQRVGTVDFVLSRSFAALVIVLGLLAVWRLARDRAVAQRAMARLGVRAPRLASWLRELHLPSPVHLVMGVLLASLTVRLLVGRDLFGYGEHDKYNDFGQGMYYSAVFLISLEYPARPSAAAPRARRLKLAIVASLCVLGMLLVVGRWLWSGRV